jgi:hypothetical protein
MTPLEDRLTILEALVARLLREGRLDALPTHAASTRSSPQATAMAPASSSVASASLSQEPDRIRHFSPVSRPTPPEPPPPEPPPPEPPPPAPPPEPDLGYLPRPHPDWLPVVHAFGPQPCGKPGLYLTHRVSGVQRADPQAVRILPRIQEGTSGLWINEPFRAPLSTDQVRCAGCVQPLEIWGSADLDYRPYLDNEIGQPMYPTPDAPPAVQILEHGEARLARMQEMADALRRSPS